MTGTGWVASDATKNSLKDERPNWISLVSVAVAVEDLKDFREDYHAIVREYMTDYGIRRRFPVLKSRDIGRWADDWEIEQLIGNMADDLLQIETLDTIQIVETSLHSQWVDVFKNDADAQERIESEEFIDRYLESYYNLISIWEYLNKPDSRPRTHRNVMTDDFSGMISPAWLSIGEHSDRLRVVPKGDETYPLLSFADILMEYVKQEVVSWSSKEIYEFLRERTPDKSAWVDSDSIDSQAELEAIAPSRQISVNTAAYYPSPTIYVDTDGVGKNKVTSTELYDYILAYARKHEGALKFFNESEDVPYMRKDDKLVLLDGKKSKYSYINEFNSTNVPDILDRQEFLQELSEDLGNDLGPTD